MEESIVLVAAITNNYMGAAPASFVVVLVLARKGPLSKAGDCSCSTYAPLPQPHDCDYSTLFERRAIEFGLSVFQQKVIRGKDRKPQEQERTESML